MKYVLLALAMLCIGSAQAAEPVVIGYRQVCDGQSCHFEPVYQAVPATIEAEQFVKATKKDSGCKCDAPCQCAAPQQVVSGRVVHFPVAREVVSRHPVRHAVGVVYSLPARVMCRWRCR